LLGLHELAPLCPAISSLGQGSSMSSSSCQSSGGNTQQQTTTSQPKDITHKEKDNKDSHTTHTTIPSIKGYHIQSACAITGDGLQQGLEALYDMILRKRKLNKVNKKKR
jgi:ADP-ribosylation factor-like protein 4